jgi:hypothetical protein
MDSKKQMKALIFVVAIVMALQATTLIYGVRERYLFHHTADQSRKILTKLHG